MAMSRSMWRAGAGGGGRRGRARRRGRAGRRGRRQSGETAMRRRMELLANPIVAVRAAHDSRSRVSNRRTEGTATLVDVAAAAGGDFALAVTDSTGLPVFVRWVGPHENLGDLTYRAEFSGYE